MPKFQAPRGTRDQLPAEMAVWRRLEDKARELSGLYGFKPIDVPMFAESLASDEVKEGSAAFVEKRPPRWPRGR